MRTQEGPLDGDYPPHRWGCAHATQAEVYDAGSTHQDCRQAGAGAHQKRDDAGKRSQHRMPASPAQRVTVDGAAMPEQATQALRWTPLPTTDHPIGHPADTAIRHL